MRVLQNPKTQKRVRRHARIRAKVFGTKDKPRFSVYRSNKFIYAQIINDEKGVTLAAASDKKGKGKTKTDRALEVGKIIAEEAKKHKVEDVVFDRGGFIYTGRVRAVAEGARKAGLKF